MAKLENEYKAMLVAGINAAGGYATRIEDQYRVGVLDLILSMPQTGIVLAEAKRFTGNVFEPSPRQYIEMCRIDDGGGKALLIGIKGDKFYLHGTHRVSQTVRGRVLAEHCVIQQENEKLPDLFIRWYKETKK